MPSLTRLNIAFAKGSRSKHIIFLFVLDQTNQESKPLYNVVILMTIADSTSVFQQMAVCYNMMLAQHLAMTWCVDMARLIKVKVSAFLFFHRYFLVDSLHSLSRKHTHSNSHSCFRSLRSGGTWTALSGIEQWLMCLSSVETPLKSFFLMLSLSSVLTL